MTLEDEKDPLTTDTDGEEKASQEVEGSTESIEGEGDAETETLLPQSQSEGEGEESGNGEIPSPLASRLDAMEKRLLDLQMENVYLKGQRSQTQPPPVTPPVQEEEDWLPPDDELERALQSNPTAAVKNLVRRAVQQAESRAEKRVASARSETINATEQFDQDEKLLQKNYGVYLDPESDQYNREFHETATHVYNGLLGQFGKVAGLKTMAASTAYGELARKGKIGKKAQETVRDKIRNVPPNPLVRTRPGTGPPTNGARDPLSGFPPDEKASIQRVCKDLGISEKDWRASYDAAKKEDPDYA